MHFRSDTLLEYLRWSQVIKENEGFVCELTSRMHHTISETTWKWAMGPSETRVIQPEPILRKIKHLGMDTSLKIAPFEKKKPNFFLIWTKSGKNNFQLGEIPPPSSLLDNASALLSNKCALLLMQRAISQEQFNSVLHFKKTIS